MTPHEQIQEKLLALDAALKEANPMMPSLLRDIHQQLRADPTVVTLLTEEEICIIVSGLDKHTGNNLVKNVLAKKGTVKSAAKSLSIDDII